METDQLIYEPKNTVQKSTIQYFFNSILQIALDADQRIYEPKNTLQKVQ